MPSLDELSAKKMASDRGVRGSLKRLVCIVEGQGEVQAVPNLCSRMMKTLGIHDWFVDPDPIRQPRSSLVNESTPSPRRVPAGGLARAVELAVVRRADGVVVMCDSDDDCPATWGPDAEAIVSKRVPGGAVMVIREFETWLLIDAVRAPRLGNRTLEGVRDAKGLLTRYVPRYKPSLHQLQLTRQMDIKMVWSCSDSFDKFVRTLNSIMGGKLPPRPNIPLLG